MSNIVKSKSDWFIEHVWSCTPESLINAGFNVRLYQFLHTVSTLRETFIILQQTQSPMLFPLHKHKLVMIQQTNTEADTCT